MEIDEYFKRAMMVGMEYGIYLGKEIMKIDDPKKRSLAFENTIKALMQAAQTNFEMYRRLNDDYKHA